VFDIFYDGSCGFCKRRAMWVGRKDEYCINLHDISSPLFLPSIWGLDARAIWEEPYGIVNDKILKGEKLVCAVLLELKYRKTVWLITHPPFKWAFATLWWFILKYKHLIPF